MGISGVKKAVQIWWWSEYECQNKALKILCILAGMLAVGVSCYGIADGDPTKFSQPAFMLKTLFLFASIVWFTTWRLHIKDLRQYGYVRRARR